MDDYDPKDIVFHIINICGFSKFLLAPRTSQTSVIKKFHNYFISGSRYIPLITASLFPRYPIFNGNPIISSFKRIAQESKLTFATIQDPESIKLLKNNDLDLYLFSSYDTRKIPDEIFHDKYSLYSLTKCNGNKLETYILNENNHYDKIKGKEYQKLNLTVNSIPLIGNYCVFVKSSILAKICYSNSLTINIYDKNQCSGLKCDKSEILFNDYFIYSYDSSNPYPSIPSLDLSLDSYFVMDRAKTTAPAINPKIIWIQCSNENEKLTPFLQNEVPKEIADFRNDGVDTCAYFYAIGIKNRKAGFISTFDDQYDSLMIIPALERRVEPGLVKFLVSYQTSEYQIPAVFLANQGSIQHYLDICSHNGKYVNYCCQINFHTPFILEKPFKWTHNCGSASSIYLYFRDIQ